MNNNLGFHIADSARLMRKRFDAAARRFNVTGTQWRVLLATDRTPGINQGQLAERLDVEPITTCRMVDRLVQAGLMERRSNPADRRAWNLYVTLEAQPLIGVVRDIGADVVGQALAGFSEEEKNLLGAMLERLRANLLDDKAFTDGAAGHG